MKLTVKTTKDKYTVEIDDGSDVKTLREKVSNEVNTPPEQICLIFAGKILKNGDSLASHGLKEGLTVHLVIRKGNSPATGTPATDATGFTTTSSTPGSGTNTNTNSGGGGIPNLFGLGGLGGLGGIEGLSGLGGLGGLGNREGTFEEMQQAMMNNPDLLAQLMNNPFIQSLLSNPEYLRTIIGANPQMQEIVERNPEIGHVLNNPEILRDTMRLARNPAAFQEMMRNQDRALSNLESIPGGYNQLRRFYTDLQEPMLDAAREQFGGNPFSSLSNNRGSNNSLNTNTAPSTTENRDPLPNPWAPRSTAGNTPDGNNSGSAPSAGGLGSVMNQPGIQSLMTQLQSNPEMMQNMMSSPYMEAMMQSLASNPQVADHIIANNPLFANNPAMQDQLRQSLPQVLEQMQNPQMRQLLANPQALDAIRRIQDGMSELSRIAPNVFGSQGSLTGAGVGQPGAVTGTAAAPTTTTAASGNTTSTASTMSSNSTPRAGESEDLGNLMANLLQGGLGRPDAGLLGGLGNLNQPPEERYRTQLEQLTAMGFVNREANIRALVASFGDVNGAIERLLQSQ